MGLQEATEWLLDAHARPPNSDNCAWRSTRSILALMSIPTEAAWWAQAALGFRFHGVKSLLGFLTPDTFWELEPDAARYTYRLCGDKV